MKQYRLSDEIEIKIWSLQHRDEKKTTVRCQKWQKFEGENIGLVGNQNLDVYETEK